MQILTRDWTAFLTHFVAEIFTFHSLTFSFSHRSDVDAFEVLLLDLCPSLGFYCHVTVTSDKRRTRPRICPSMPWQLQRRRFAFRDCLLFWVSCFCDHFTSSIVRKKCHKICRIIFRDFTSNVLAFNKWLAYILYKIFYKELYYLTFFTSFVNIVTAVPDPSCPGDVTTMTSCRCIR